MVSLSSIPIAPVCVLWTGGLFSVNGGPPMKTHRQWRTDVLLHVAEEGPKLGRSPQYPRLMHEPCEGPVTADNPGLKREI